MKTFKFKYVEISLAGNFSREIEILAKTEKSAWSKFFQIQGNRTFDQISLIAK